MFIYRIYSSVNFALQTLRKTLSTKFYIANMHICHSNVFTSTDGPTWYQLVESVEPASLKNYIVYVLSCSTDKTSVSKKFINVCKCPLLLLTFFLNTKRVHIYVKRGCVKSISNLHFQTLLFR